MKRLTLLILIAFMTTLKPCLDVSVLLTDEEAARLAEQRKLENEARREAAEEAKLLELVKRGDLVMIDASKLETKEVNDDI